MPGKGEGINCPQGAGEPYIAYGVRPLYVRELSLILQGGYVAGNGRSRESRRALYLCPAGERVGLYPVRCHEMSNLLPVTLAFKSLTLLRLGEFL